MNPGVYPCRVTEAFWSVSSQKKTPCIAVRADVDDMGEVTSLLGAIYFTDATVGSRERPGFAIRQLQELGYEGPLSALHPEPSALVGKGCKCVVEANDKGNLRIAQFGVFGVAHVAMELSRLQALDAKLGRKAGAGDPDADKRRAEDAAAAKGLAEHPEPGENFGKETEDEDIPF